MHRARRLTILATLLAVAPVLAGCSDFDMDKLDVFHLTDKKKLPGERRELFPGGVPGVTQGVPPQYTQGYQAPTESAETLPPGSKVDPGDQDAAAALKPDAQAAAAAPAEEPKPKPKQKPKPKLKTAKQHPPAQVTIQRNNPAQSPWPAAPSQPQQQSGPSPWPAAPSQQQSQPQQAQQQPAAQSPWPDPKSTSNDNVWPSPPANSQ
jgi:hypothetical protein